MEIKFCPKYPVIWFAEYHKNIKELKIPKCNKCNELIKVKNYNNVICQNCKNNDITWSVDEGAKNIKIGHYIFEFDEKGNQTIEYKYLPLDGLIKFGLLDPVASVEYGIEINTGYITIRDFTTNNEAFYLGTGINTNNVATNLIKVSDAIIKGEAKLELYHSKQVVINGQMRVSLLNLETNHNFQMDPSNLTINNIAVGYTCQIENLNFEVIIRIDCNNHLPYFTSKTTPIRKQEN